MLMCRLLGPLCFSLVRTVRYHTDPATTKAFMYAFMTIHKKTKQDPTRNPGNLVDEVRILKSGCASL